MPVLYKISMQLGVATQWAQVHLNNIHLTLSKCCLNINFSSYLWTLFGFFYLPMICLKVLEPAIGHHSKTLNNTVCP